VQSPGAGDDLQAAKAGLMECADVFAVNKADLAGAETAVAELQAMLALAGSIAAPSLVALGHGAAAGAAVRGAATAGGSHWVIPVQSCVAARDEGVAELLSALDSHRTWLFGTPFGAERRARRLRDELIARLRDAFTAALFERHKVEIEDAALRIAADRGDPYAASRELVARWLGGAASLG
jgi:LAO/AO transport system kinase